MIKFLRGFRYAFEGIIHCIKNERNMRIHTVAALYVLVFARFFTFTGTEYAILLLTIGGVLAAEAVNTAIEDLADKLSEEQHPLIKSAKDSAAGAVLILAAFSVFIALFLFSEPEGLQRVLQFYGSHPYHLMGLIASSVLSLIFIILGPTGIASLFRKK